MLTRTRTPDSQDTSPNKPLLEVRGRRQLLGAVVLVLVAMGVFSLALNGKRSSEPAPVVLEIPLKPGALPIPGVAGTGAAGSASVAISGNGSLRSAATTASTPASGQHGAASVVASVTASPSSANKAPAGAASGVVATGTVATRSAAVTPVEGSAARTSASTPPTANAAKASTDNQSTDHSRALAILEGRASTVASAAATSPPGNGAVSAKPGNGDESTRQIIQAGSFADAEHARELIARLKRANLPVRGETVEAAGTKRMRVLVGPYQDALEAQAALAQVRKIAPGASLIKP